MIPRPYEAGPLFVGRRNCEAATGLMWRRLDELMRLHGAEPIAIGATRLYEADLVVEVLGAVAAEAAPEPAEQSDEQVLRELRAGLGRQLRRAG